MLRLIPALLLISLVSAAGETAKPFQYSYYLFEDTKQLDGSRCYIPLLVTREPLDGLAKHEVAVIVTYERDSIWNLRNKLAVVEPPLTKDDIAARKVRFEGKLYRYQLVANDETLRLLKNLLGTIAIHRKEPPFDSDKIDPIALIERIQSGKPAEKSPDMKETLLTDLSAQAGPPAK